MRITFRILVVATLALVLPQSSQARVDFNRDIRPILSENCFQCHGPDEKARKGGSIKTGGLRLDSHTGATRDIGGYAAVVPGNPTQSELIYLITAEDEEDRMPPKEEGDRLDKNQIGLLWQWIEEGGHYDVHWAYQKPRQPDVPRIESVDLRINNPVDNFISEKLVSNHLTQSPEANPYALARRAALDLTGLPPTPKEVHAFVKDGRPKAFERYVQMLLDKPAYGEHWARMWLDLARYADSAGYADDPLREIWAYRDYVIRSFNQNKPFDQFTIEQIAGDLIKNPTTEQLVATAFHRNTKTNSEGGTNDEEFRNEAVVDRVNTTMAVWMATTIDCAQCHTHKYDPISQEEYFKMFAIFNNTVDEDRKDEMPLLPLYTQEQKAKKRSLDTQIADLRQSFAEKLSGEKDLRHAWEQRLISEDGWIPLVPDRLDIETDSKAEIMVDEDGLISVGDNAAPRDAYTILATIPEKFGSVTGLKLEVPAHEDIWVLNEIELRTVTEAERKDKDPNEEVEQKKIVPKHNLIRPSASFEQEWYVAKDLIDGNRYDRFTGWAVKGNLDQSNQAAFDLAEPIELGEGEKLQIKLFHNFPNRKLKQFKFQLSNLVKPMPAVPFTLLDPLTKKPEARSRQEEAKLLRFFADHYPKLTEEQTTIADLQNKLYAIEPKTTVPIMREVPKSQVRKTHIQHRGNYLDKRAEVTPGTPAIFPPIPKDSISDRLGLAKWLVSDDNPLTARVVVNRHWEALFGQGLVLTSEEFGSQGELPSHPELLDWLAVELMANDWDLKRLLTLMVTSATYRQSSKLIPKLLEKDPDNRWLARGPRFRISAETVRDQALAVSGLMNTAMYGPSVRPLQPEFGLKSAFGGVTDWEPSVGEDKYRRGIYTTWRRSNPYPSMVAFDAPNREFCTIRRDRTNTPLQALVTLNDPVYIEASQALGRRLEAIRGNLDEKLEYGFQLCLSRPPSEKEVEALAGLYEDTRSRYSKNYKSAMKMATIPIGDLPQGANAAQFAAWAVVGNALLNLDEMFLKR